MSKRNLFAVSIKHSEYKWKFGDPLVLWGRRTKDDEKRCYSGYTQFPNYAELYSLEDWEKSGYCGSECMKITEPVHMDIKLCKTWKNYDTVLIPYDEIVGYYMMAGLQMDKPSAR